MTSVTATGQDGLAPWRVRLTLGLLVTLLWLAVLASARAQVLGDPDIWWHIKTGEWMVQNRAFPTADPFSYTFAGQPWIAKEWLSQLLYFLAHDAAGWNGVMLLALLALGLAAFALYWALSEVLSPIQAAFFAIAGLALASPNFTVRPHLLTLVIIIVWTHQLFSASARGRAPAYGWLLLILLWANLHAAFTMGFVIAFFAFLDYVETHGLARRDVLLKWFVFLALCPLVTLIHPYSWQAMFSTLTVVAGNETVPLITEWQPFNAQTDLPQHAALMMLIFFGTVSGFRLGFARALLLVLLLHLFLTHGRYGFFLFPILPILIAPALAQQFPKVSAESWSKAPRDGLESSMITSFGVWSAVLGGAFVVLALVQAVLLPTAPKPSAAAPDAFAFIKANKLTGNVFNSYDFGGPLIFHGIKTFIDGRTDRLFLGGFSTKYMKGPDNDAGLAAVINQYDIRWSILTEGDPRNALFDKLPGWSRVYGDDEAVIHQRKEPPAK